MAADDLKESEELQRRQALEEIRRRAEEAELKRIEELEKQSEASGPPTFPPSVAAPGEPSPQVTFEELRRYQAEDRPLAEAACPVDPEIMSHRGPEQLFQPESARSFSW